MAKTTSNAKKIGRGGRKRRIAGWTLLLLGLLVAGVWGASGWFRFVSYTRSGSMVILAGNVELSQGFTTREGWSGGPLEKPPVWLAPTGTNRSMQTDWNIAIASQQTWPQLSMRRWVVIVWPIPLLLWTPAALLLRSGILARRRAKTGSCPKCGYSLAGLGADSPCPECGGGRRGAGIT